MKSIEGAGPALSPPPSPVVLVRALRLAPAARYRASTELLSLTVRHVKLTHTLACVCIRDPDRCTLPFRDLCTRHIRNTNRLPSQNSLLLYGIVVR